MLPELPVALRRSELAAPYLSAEAAADHPAAGSGGHDRDGECRRRRRVVAGGHLGPSGAVALRAGGDGAGGDARGPADRRPAFAAGDPLSARRYYAEAISEARDLGAEREQGLAALGMGRAAMDLSDVTTARRLGQIAEELLERAAAPPNEIAAARELRGEEKEVS